MNEKIPSQIPSDRSPLPPIKRGTCMIQYDCSSVYQCWSFLQSSPSWRNNNCLKHIDRALKGYKVASAICSPKWENASFLMLNRMSSSNSTHPWGPRRHHWPTIIITHRSGTWSCSPCIQNPMDGQFYGTDQLTSDGVMGHCWMDTDCLFGSVSIWKPFTNNPDFNGLNVNLQFNPGVPMGKTCNQVHMSGSHM